MPDSVTNNFPHIKVENFGPIIDAEFDLRPLTVFVGPSNTGKSYLAILIYAIWRHFGSYSLRHTGYSYRRTSSNAVLTFEDLTHLLDDLLDAFLAVKEANLPTDSIEVSLPPAIRKYFVSIIEQDGSYLSREISRCFGIHATSELIRIGNADSSLIEFGIWSNSDSSKVDNRLILKSKRSEFSSSLNEDYSLKFNRENFLQLIDELKSLINFANIQKNESRDNLAFVDFDLLCGYLLSKMTNPFQSSAYYLPADRTGVMHAHSVVVSTLIERASQAGLQHSSPTPLLSGVLADFLTQLINFAEHRGIPRYSGRNSSEIASLSEVLEKGVLGGSIDIQNTRAIPYPHFVYRPKGWKTIASVTDECLIYGFGVGTRSPVPSLRCWERRFADRRRT